MGFTTNRINEVAMNKFEALELIKEAWENENLSLERKINMISESFYSVGLDLASTANYIKVTPAELDVFLSLSNLDEEIIHEISKANPPKSTWLLLASGNDEEIKKALDALSSASKNSSESVCEFLYQQMIEVAGKTQEQLIAELTVNDLFDLAKKAKNFNSVSQSAIKYLNSFAAQKKHGRVLSEKQIETLKNILNDLADNKVVQRNSIDGDCELCDRVLDAIDR